jgi:hypothetical protein
MSGWCGSRATPSAIGRLAWGFRCGEMGQSVLSRLVSLLIKRHSWQGHHLSRLEFTLMLEESSRSVEIRPFLILGSGRMVLPQPEGLANPGSNVQQKCICGSSSLFETCYAFPMEQLVLSLDMHMLHTLSVSASLFLSPTTLYYGGVDCTPWANSCCSYLELQSEFLRPTHGIS